MLARLKSIQQKGSAERGEHFANIVRAHPHLELCEDRLSIQEELQAIQRCPLYDGVLIIFNRNKEQGEENNGL